MTQITKRKILSGALRGSSTIVAAAVPIWLIAQKFPLWATEQSTTVTLTGGGIVVVLIACMVFRKKLFMAVKPLLTKIKKMRGVVIGTVLVSGAILGICYLVRQIYPIMPDIETICMGGVVSGLGGVGLDVAAIAVAPKKAEGEEPEQKEA